MQKKVSNEKSELRQLIREQINSILNEDYYPGPSSEKEIEEIDEDHADQISRDISEYLGEDVMVMKIYKMRNENKWWISATDVGSPSIKPKSFYIKVTPYKYQHNPKDMETSTHGYPAMSELIYKSSELDD